MEEEEAAAYYQDLVRRGSNAARFKQGLGFGSSSAADASGDGGAVWTKGGAGLTFVAASGCAASFERENLEPPTQKSPGGGAAPIADTSFAESFERKLQAGLADARVASVRDKLRRGGSDGGNAGRRADREGDGGRIAERKDVERRKERSRSRER
ncbi:unnamed protein product, partial [Closterium sp. Naga37s-1]